MSVMEILNWMDLQGDFVWRMVPGVAKLLFAKVGSSISERTRI